MKPYEACKKAEVTSLIKRNQAANAQELRTASEKLSRGHVMSSAYVIVVIWQRLSTEAIIKLSSNAMNFAPARRRQK